MLRISKFILALCLVAGGAQADPAAEQVRRDAYAGDVDAVEAAFAQAHKDHSAGLLPLDDLRSLVSVLNTTHPDLIAFQSQWLTAYPASPYALTLRANGYFDAAFRARGHEFSNRTHPDALQAFHDLGEAATQMALQAYDIAPDYVPAADTLLSLQNVTHPLDDAAKFALTDDVMQFAPNLGTLQRALSSAEEKWGGAGLPEIKRYCDAFAGLIPTEPGFTTDVCIARIVGWNARTGPEIEAARQLAETTGHVNLGGLRRQLALERRSPADRAVLEAYLLQRGNDDWWTATQFAQSFDVTPDIDNALRTIDWLALSRRRDWLRHDPFNAGVIDFLLNQAWSTRPGKAGHPVLTDGTRRMLRKRLTLAHPFDAAVWFETGQYMFVDSDDDAPFAPYFENAIYYSQHDAGILQQVMIMTLRALQTEDWLSGATGDAAPAITRDAAQLCPVIRLSRVFEAVCANALYGTCEDMSEAYPMAAIKAAVTSNNLCQHERTAAVQDLLYAPVTIPAGDILSGIANRGEAVDPNGFALAP